MSTEKIHFQSDLFELKGENKKKWQTKGNALEKSLMNFNIGKVGFSFYRYLSHHWQHKYLSSSIETKHFISIFG